MNRRGSAITGAVLVILGGLLLTRNLGIFKFPLDMGFVLVKLWPLLFLIIPGLIFHSVFFSGRSRDAGLLVPGGILLVLGVVFQINILFNLWHLMWPFYIMSVAVGLFELYMFGNRDKGLLIPVGILGGLSLTFFTGFSLSQIFSYNTIRLLVPGIFILIGIIILLKGRTRRF